MEDLQTTFAMGRATILGAEVRPDSQEPPNMLTDQEKAAFRKARERARVALQSGGRTESSSMWDATTKTLRHRLNELREEAIRADDASAYDDTARFHVGEVVAWRRELEAHVGQPRQA